MIVPLVAYNDPVLRRPTTKFDLNNPQVDPMELATNMVDTMRALKGIGLAANQIGVPYSMSVIDTDPVRVLINPELISAHIEHKTEEEGCLSYPGILVDVPRPKECHIRFTYPNGERFTEPFVGLTARILQHELEHLNGKAFFHQASRLQMERAIKASNKHYGTKYTLANLGMLKFEL